MVQALRKTSDLWGGKLKHFETPTRNRILHIALSHSAYSAAKDGPIVSNNFVAKGHDILYLMKGFDLAAELEGKISLQTDVSAAALTPTDSVTYKRAELHINKL